LVDGAPATPPAVKEAAIVSPQRDTRAAVKKVRVVAQPKTAAKPKAKPKGATKAKTPPKKAVRTPTKKTVRKVKK
jgi:hypothetical protein